MTKSKFPASVSILGKKVAITYKPLKNLFGNYDINTKTINIDSNLSDRDTKSTLFHEMIHACIDISGQSEHLTEAQIEGVVISIENGMLGNFTI